jgi:protein tyrosine phosphatase (PTP) superfamily phosphohydrolase (DUF442 family)
MRRITEIAPELVNAADPAHGIATAGQPTPEHLESLAREGYGAVIDLRTPDEDRGFAEPETVRSAGMEYVNLPLESDPAAFEETAFDRFRELMRGLENQPALIHCRTAARVEPLLLAYLILDRGYDLWRAEEAVENIGARKEELHDRALAYLQNRGAV